MFFSVHCWPRKQGLRLADSKSQLGWTQWKLMFADASPASTPRDKIAVFILD
jgi:hypothetical protein